MQAVNYWSGTERFATTYAYYFSFSSGYQYYDYKNSSNHPKALAVRPGVADAGRVYVPHPDSGQPTFVAVPPPTDDQIQHHANRGNACPFILSQINVARGLLCIL